VANGLIDNEIKKVVAGQLLEVLKITFNTQTYLPKGKADFKTLSNLQEDIWKSIAQVAGMPGEKREGFVADKHIATAYNYATNDLSRDEAVNKILNWESDTIVVVGEEAENKKAASARTPAADI
jgi:hypothetical protein